MYSWLTTVLVVLGDLIGRYKACRLGCPGGSLDWRYGIFHYFHYHWSYIEIPVFAIGKHEFDGMSARVFEIEDLIDIIKGRLHRDNPPF